MERPAATSQTFRNRRAIASSGSSSKRHRLKTLIATTAGALLGACSLLPAPPRLVWNHTASAPIGLYLINRIAPHRGDILAIKPAGAAALILNATRALAGNRVLLKPLAALTGDTVCRDGDVIRINGAVAARARDVTAHRPALPVWTGCIVLDARQVFVLSSHPASLDGRYFGPTDVSDILGVARPILVFSPHAETR